MNSWKTIALSPDISVIEAMKVIDKAGTQFIVIISPNDELLGAVTDGDIRRGILRNIALTAPVTEVMKPHPFTLPAGTSRKKALTFLLEKNISHVPLVDEKGIVKDIIGLLETKASLQRPNTVVLMVGGLGSRLGGLTSNCPKPMLQIGGKPVLEIIINNLREHGFSNFILCVNYKAEMISDYFGNGERFGIDIRYVHESKRMGTAGALALLPEDVNGPLLIMNGDIITKVNFSQLLDFHLQQATWATMGVRKYDFEIPYGVVKTDNGVISGIEEKPIHTFLVSAGIYIIEKESFNYLPKDEFFDMPQLFESLIKAGNPTQAFPIHEYWVDIGREDDLVKAQEDYFNDGIK